MYIKIDSNNKGKDHSTQHEDTQNSNTKRNSKS
jgi:hypothetical protein